MKIDKSNFGWIFACCGLVVLLGISIFLGVTGWFINTDVTYTTDLELGKTIQVDIDKNESNAVSLTLDGSFLEGQKLPQVISVKAIQDEGELFIRAKIFIYTSENETKKLEVDNTANWFKNEDDYYYLTGTIAPNDKISLCSNIILPNGINLLTGRKYIVTIIFESLAQSQNVLTLWGINPLENV